MSSINSNNYEAFFLDYLEGNLNAQQEFELMDFLDKNPGLKAELDLELGELTLQPENLSLDKGDFKKVGIQPEEVDELMIASVEGQLSLEATSELNAYVNTNNLTADFNYYKNTLLKPDLSEGYGDVSDLKKKDHVFIPLWIKAAGAISVGVVIIGTSIYQFRDSEEPAADKNIQIPLLKTDVETVEHNDVYTLEETELSVVEDKDFNDVENSNTFGSIQDDDQQEKITTPTNQNGTDLSEGEDLTPKEEPTLIVPDTKEDPVPTEKMEDTQEGSIKSEGSKEKPEPKDQDKSDPNNSEKPLKDVKETEEKIKSREEYIKLKEETVVDANVFKREVSWKREKDTESGEVVSHKIKLGKFEFERKKK